MPLLRVYWATIKHINHQGYIYVWANILWILLTIPIVTAPAAWAALVHLSHKAHTQPRVNLEDFWEGFKQHFQRSLILGGITLVIVIVNVTNLLAYAPLGGIEVAAMRVVWMVALFLWFSILLYFWQIIEEMESPSLWGGLRNAAVLVLQNPLFTIGLWLGIIPFIILSTILLPAWFLLTGSAVAALATNAVLDRLHLVRQHPVLPTPSQDQINADSSK